MKIPNDDQTSLDALLDSHEPEKMILSEKDYEMLTKMLDNPPPPTWRLVEAMNNRKVSWLTKIWLNVKMTWWKILFYGPF